MPTQVIIFFFLFQRKRCGLPDLPPQQVFTEERRIRHYSHHTRRNRRYVLTPEILRWNKPDLTYR